MIRVICKCGFHGQVPANYVGKQVTCRKCGDVIAVSAEPTPPVPAANENPFGDVDSPGPSGDQARRRDAMAKHAGLMIFLGFGAILLGVGYLVIFRSPIDAAIPMVCGASVILAALFQISKARDPNRP